MKPALLLVRTFGVKKERASSGAGLGSRGPASSSSPMWRAGWGMFVTAMLFSGKAPANDEPSYLEVTGAFRYVVCSIGQRAATWKELDAMCFPASFTRTDRFKTLEYTWTGEAFHWWRQRYGRYAYTSVYHSGPSAGKPGPSRDDAHAYYRAIWVKCPQTDAPPVCRDPGPVTGVNPEANRGAPETCAGNPINIGTANKFQSETDYVSRSIRGVSLIRYYNSHDDTEGSLGIAWRHGYERRLNLGSNEIKAVRPDGRTYTFTPEGTGWQSDPDVTETLEATSGGWTYTTEVGTEEAYDSEGRLLTITHRTGRTQTLAYATDGRLASVVDAYGRSLQFTYDSEGRLATLTDPAGTTAAYTYREDRLGSVTYPDGSERRYSYDNADYPNALTAIADGTGTVIASWTYDENGWATASSHASGADDTQVTYNGDDSVTVTNPLGKKTTYHFKVYHGVPKVVSVEGHATATCEGANRAYTYDANGFLLSKTDWRGNVTTYIRDEQGRELSRTEAVGTPQERTVTTEWHPAFNEPVRITEPGQITGLTYDAEGRLLSRTMSTANQ